ncbi:FAD-binding FR-type domain-containing protein, partial [Psidium guajava]
RVVRLAMKVLIMVVFLGYVLILIMMPTNIFYLRWMPNILSRTHSTYFGQQGASLLIYAFPILFIATLSAFYSHLGTRGADRSDSRVQGRSSRYDSWKMPALVKGPLGIVSWIELALLTMFLALLVWSFSSYVHAMFANVAQEAIRVRERMWEVKLDSAALLLGLVGNICLAFLFFPVTRGSSVLHFIGVTSEASVKYHIWFGHITMALFTAHGLCYAIFWADTHQISEMIKWQKIGVSNVAGEISLLAGVVMWATAFQRIRRKMFELFFYSHYLYIIFVLFFVLHVGFSTACLMLPGFYLFLIDRYLRFLQSRRKIRLVCTRVLPCQAVELNFSKSPGLSYTPTSTAFLNVPSISKLQWHPFTITSSSNLDPDKLSIVVKSEGRWTKMLYEILSSSSPVERLEISLEGPYGPPSTNLLRHDMLVMISGGSGITPFISIIRELLFAANTATHKAPRILLICAFKKELDLAMLELLLPDSGTNLDISLLHLQIEAYVTREKETVKDDEELIRTVWLKPSTNDAPVSAVLGSRSWLWLGLIISSSVLIFLVLVGIITRYYIYPTERDSNGMYLDASRAALYVIFACVSIAASATGAFLWNKKQSSREVVQIQDMNAPTAASPGASGYGGDWELECLPRQTLIQSTNVHYGKRPDLKKIFMGIEASSIGVLASGPWKLRQDVAAICSSGSVANLHFQSISFSW